MLDWDQFPQRTPNLLAGNLRQNKCEAPNNVKNFEHQSLSHRPLSRSLVKVSATALTVIHSSAVVSPKAELGSDVEIGPYCVVGEQVQIGDRTRLHAHLVI